MLCRVLVLMLDAAGITDCEADGLYKRLPALIVHVRRNVIQNAISSGYFAGARMRRMLRSMTTLHTARAHDATVSDTPERLVPIRNLRAGGRGQNDRLSLGAQGQLPQVAPQGRPPPIRTSNQIVAWLREA